MPEYDKQYIRLIEEVLEDECRVCRVDEDLAEPAERPFRLVIETEDKLLDTGPIPMCTVHLLQQTHQWEQAGLNPRIER